MLRWFIFCLVLFAQLGESAEKTICLNMIVKNESDVITRCLKTVKPYVDYWVIVDTGSTDGTQKIIREFMRDTPGEIYERPWVDFAHNRNEALKLARDKGDYVLFMDADEELEGVFDKNSLAYDAYLGNLRTSQDYLTTALRPFLINNELDWSWRGVLHESIHCERDVEGSVMPNIIIATDHHDGYRAKDPQKYLKDARVLEKALLDEPDNADYVYYLAQSYYNAKEFPLALENFQKRAQMGGWDQQVFWAQYYVGMMQELLGMDSELIVRSYMDAFKLRPTRAEPIFRLANYFHTKKNYLLGYLLAQFGQTIPMPNDIIYKEDWIYSYGMLAVLANCALEMGRDAEALALYEKISTETAIPKEVCQQALSTMEYLKNKKERSASL